MRVGIGNVGPSLPFRSTPLNVSPQPGIILDSPGITVAGQSLTLTSTSQPVLGFVQRSVGPVLPFASSRLNQTFTPPTIADVTLSLDAGSVTIAGQVLSFGGGGPVVGRVNTDFGPYFEFTPQLRAKTLPFGIQLGTALVTIAGQSLSFNTNLSLSLSAGSVSVAGQSLSLLVSTPLDLNAGSISVDGQSITLSGPVVLTLLPGSISVTGQSLTIPEIAGPIFSGTIADIAELLNSGTHTFELGSNFRNVSSYSITPGIEPGWSFNTSTGELTIDTDQEGVFGSYSITGTNSIGSVTSNFFLVRVESINKRRKFFRRYRGYDAPVQRGDKKPRR